MTTKLERYRDHLTAQGFRPEMHDGYLTFRHEGGVYVMPAEESDAGYFRLLFPRFWSIDSDDERRRALLVASHVTARMKTAKVFVVDGDTFAAIEMFLPSAESFTAVFDRSLHVLQQAAHQFRLGMAPPPPGIVAKPAEPAKERALPKPRFRIEDN